MSNNKSSLYEANVLFNNGNYEAARKLYLEAAILFGEDFVRANIILCDNRIEKSSSIKTFSSKVDTSAKINNCIEYVIDSIRKYPAYRESVELLSNKDLPKVSYIVTAFNAEETIEKSISSLLQQNYPNIEIVICDDFSTDRTWEKLQAIQNNFSKSVRIFRSNVNGGTYLAKNIAIENSSGEFILFQDADDYSHPDRTIVQVYPLIKNSELIASRTKYARFNPETKSIITVGDNLSKYGLITLAIRKQAFEEVGYFDCVRKAGDDDFFQRVRHLYGKNRIKQLDVTLYLAELRENSLVADMISFNSDGSVNQSSSNTRKQYVKIFQSHFADKSKRRQWYCDNYPSYPSRAIRKYPKGIASLEVLEEKVFASVCCIPERVESFKVVVDRILPQVDHLYVYLDKFSEVPDYLKNNRKITAVLAKNYKTDYRDNAKFIHFNKIKKEQKSFYYFTIDDDILYPYDYVRSMIDRLRDYENKVVVGIHGVMYEEIPKKYFRRRFVYHFQETQLYSPLLVNNLGTGTVAFHSKIFNAISPDTWKTGGMVDILFSKECRKNNIAMVCIDRHSNWLMETEESIGSPNLFNEYKAKNKELKILDELSTMLPWGYKGIQNVIKDDKYVDMGLEKMLPEFANDTLVSSFFHRYR